MDVESYYCVLEYLCKYSLGAVFHRVVRLAVGFFKFLFSPFDIFPYIGPQLFCCNVF